MADFLTFQYKICSSKIDSVPYKEIMDFCFNTKFVQAKCAVGDSMEPYICEFQYKICSSKITYTKTQSNEKFLFQYKICSSKIVLALYTLFALLRFNTKFVQAKSYQN
ncbi:Uncharacterised protein [Campylobacter geochelonis]|uniref:Uncharacterized protein n=1 Tax=Campylobacter geochelonis TaxID=1780362 RepID=A0A128EEV2_9BACT|nr:Uncharacterised protein [Campylobacter geochelonis]